MSSEFDDAPVSDLDQDVELSSKDADLTSKLRAEEDLRQLVQANDLREQFYRRAAMLATVSVFTSVALVVGYTMTALIYGFEPPAAVAIGFISGLAVQTVGVLAIVGRYLFPPDQKTP